MTTKPVALGADHAGFALKEEIRKHLDEIGVPYKDFGAYSTESVDYPKMAVAPCQAVLSGECEVALLFCGTGIGISLSANKIKGIRAFPCSDSYSCEYGRRHNDANVLCLGGRVVASGLACQLVDIFLNTSFEGGRHARRVNQISELEETGAIC
jgi:ribose 5-phosphate isomerase B